MIAYGCKHNLAMAENETIEEGPVKREKQNELVF